MARPLILLTNDDGIGSPGLAAAAAALDPLGELLIAAPALQQTSMGRSRSQQGDKAGLIQRRRVCLEDQSWDGFAVYATPALAVEYGVQALAGRPIALAVSGINYGENIGACITASGTVGAAFEAAELGIPAVAISLETGASEYFEYDEKINFRVAGHFLRFFAAQILHKTFPPDVDVLKIEVPAAATQDTGWMVTRQDRLGYYRPTLTGDGKDLEGRRRIEMHPAKGQFTQQDTDAFALAKGLVSVTALSLDLSSRAGLDEIQKLFTGEPLR